MKKSLLFIFSLVAINFICKAQYYYIPVINSGNPDGLNKDLENPTGGGGWIPLGTPPSATPKWFNALIIPFPFSFNGTPVTKFKVSSSGVLTFSFNTTMAAPAYGRVALPDATIPDSSVCITGLASLGTNDYVLRKTFGIAPHRQFWIQFSSYSYGTTTGDGNNYTYWAIVLEETTNNIYIVDLRNAGYTGARLVSAGIQVNSSTAIAVNGSPNLTGLSGSGNTADDNSYYQFVYGTQQAIDVGVRTQTLIYNIQKNESNTVSGLLMNYGKDTIKSLTLNYQLNNGAIISDPKTSLSIPMFGTYNYTHSVPWIPSAAAFDTMKIWCDNINGSADMFNINDTLTSGFRVFDSLFIKKVLIEECTQASCDPCANYNPHLDSSLYALMNIHTMIRYHPNFPGQDFMNQVTQPQVSARIGYYGINAAPTVVLDGGPPNYPGGIGLTSLSTTLIQKKSAVRTPFHIGIPTANFIQSTDSFTITVDLTAYGDFSGDFRAFAVITDSLHYNKNQSTETIPQYAFSDVMEQMLPSTTGQPLASFTSGQTQTLNFGWKKGRPLAANYANYPYDSSQFMVVVFVQDYTSRFVWQSERALVNTVPVGIKPNIADVSYFNLYPNPFHTTAYIDIGLKEPQQVTVEMYNTVGSSVYFANEGILSTGVHKLTLDKNNLLPGIYFLRVATEHGQIIHKLVIE